MATSVTQYAENSTWFSSGVGGKTCTVSYSAGDIIVVAGGIEVDIRSFNTPTATGLTFAQQSLQDAATDTEAAAGIWTATAAAGGSGVVITQSITGAGNSGLAAWVVSGGSTITGIAGSLANAAFTGVTVGAGDCVIVFLAEFTAVNPPGLTPGTGSGTATERVDIGDGATYGVWGADWVNTSAGTFSFGATSYGALNTAQVGVIITSAGPSTPVLEQTRYRWGLDDGTETGHTFAAAENTAVTLAAGDTRLLRIQVDETAGVATGLRPVVQWRRSDEPATEWRTLTT